MQMSRGETNALRIISMQMREGKEVVSGVAARAGLIGVSALAPVFDWRGGAETILATPTR